MADTPGLELVTTTVSRLQEKLLAAEPKVRADRPDAVHTMRVATRQLRSVLATYRRVLDRTKTDPVRRELAWLAAVLGQSRDAEVLRAACARLVAEQPVELLPGDVGAHLDAHLATRSATALRAVVRTLDTQRYARLLANLAQLVTDPPPAAGAGDPATKVAKRALRREWKRVRAAHRTAVAAATEAEREELLHDVRKAAKRLRYAAESAEPVLGKRARRLAERAEDVQEVLGRHHDDVVIEAFLIELAERAHDHGDKTFGYGRLHAAVAADAAATERAYTTAWHRLRRS